MMYKNNMEIEQILENKNSELHKVMQDPMTGSCRENRLGKKTKRKMHARMEGTKRQGCPRSRQMDKVKKDL